MDNPWDYSKNGAPPEKFAPEEKRKKWGASTFMEHRSCRLHQQATDTLGKGYNKFLYASIIDGIKHDSISHGQNVTTIDKFPIKQQKPTNAERSATFSDSSKKPCHEKSNLGLRSPDQLHGSYWQMRARRKQRQFPIAEQIQSEDGSPLELSIEDQKENAPSPGQNGDYWCQRKKRKSTGLADMNIPKVQDLTPAENTATTIQSMGGGKNCDQQWPQIFTGCTAYFNGDTSKALGLSSFHLQRLFILHGGTFRLMPGQHISHVVCDTLAISKVHKAIHTKTRHNRYYITPDWVTESIRAGRRLNENLFSSVVDKTMPDLRRVVDG